MKIEELRNLPKEELLNKEKSLKEELFKLNLQRYGSRVEKPHMFGLIKRDIARIKTLLNEPRPSLKAKISLEEGRGEKREQR